MNLIAKPSLGVALFVVAVLTVGAGVFLWWPPADGVGVGASLEAEQEVITYSVERPSTEKVVPTVLPKGRMPNDPVHIALPSIGAEGDIVKVGIDQEGAIAAPTNIHQAGWFVNSVRPGEKGLSIINGHIDPRTNTAIFENLANIKEGEMFEVRLSSGAVRRYVVRSVVVLPTEESAAALFSQLPKVSSQLNLITCAGAYDRDQGLFTHRTVVAGELAE